MCQLHSICRRDCARDTGTQPKDESPSDELAHPMCRCLNRRTNKHNYTADEDGKTSTVAVAEPAAEGEGGNLAEIVGDEDDAR